MRSRRDACLIDQVTEKTERLVGGLNALVDKYRDLIFNVRGLGLYQGFSLTMLFQFKGSSCLPSNFGVLRRRTYRRGLCPPTCETPYGPARVQRHACQNGKGERAYVPLEHDARMILNSTPRYGQVVSDQ